MQYRVFSEYGESQYGLVTKAQLLTECTRAQLERLLSQHALIQEQAGVYRIGGTPLSWHQRLMAAVLRNPKAQVSHRAALQLYGILDVSKRQPLVEVTIPEGRSPRLRNVITHRTDLMRPPRTVQGLLVTPPERALIDSAIYLGEYLATKMIDEALYKHLTTFADLRAELTLIEGRGRPGVGIIRGILERYDPKDDKRTWLERLVAKEFRRRGLPLPEEQWEVWPEGQQRFLDFAYPDLQIGIEAHSKTWHTRLTAFENDDDRDGALTSEGWQIFYVNESNMDDSFGRIKRQLPPNYARFSRTDTA